MSLAIAMKNVPTVRHQTICAVGFARWHSRRSPCARLTDPGCPDRTTLVARCGVLSAVADRIGWWAPLGQGDWSSMSASAEYARQLVPFASGWFLTVTVWVPPPPKRTSESCSWLAGAQNSLARRLAWCSPYLESRWLYRSVWNHRLATVSSPQQALARPMRSLTQHRRQTPLKPRTTGALPSLDNRTRHMPTDGEYLVEKLDHTLHPLSVARTRMKM